jgi:hypothetical protein
VINGNKTVQLELIDLLPIPSGHAQRTTEVFIIRVRLSC